MFETEVVSATQQENVISRLACSIRRLRACVLLQVFYPSPQYPLNGCRGLSLLRLGRREMRADEVAFSLAIRAPVVAPVNRCVSHGRSPLATPVSVVSIVVGFAGPSDWVALWGNVLIRLAAVPAFGFVTSLAHGANRAVAFACGPDFPLMSNFSLVMVSLD